MKEYLGNSMKRKEALTPEGSRYLKQLAEDTVEAQEQGGRKISDEEIYKQIYAGWNQGIDFGTDNESELRKLVSIVRNEM